MSSEVLYTDFGAKHTRFERVDILKSDNALCEYFIVSEEGRSLFMKRLKEEHVNDMVCRSILAKEHDIGITINHPNTVKHISINDDEHGYYLLMENIVGVTLDQFIIDNPDYFHSRKNLDKFFNQLLSALKCLHENHVVYSDLKPQNIMITQVGNDVKLIDFGFCMSNTFTTTAGTTEGYSSPEQISNGTLNIATDIYSIGKIIEYIGLHISNSLPNIYARIMIKCTKQRQIDRFQSTDEIVQLINRRSHMIRKLIIVCITCVVLFFAYRTITYTEEFNSWWDSFEILTPQVEYDVELTSTRYRILSEKDKTCEVVGHTTNPNVYIKSYVTIDGKTYRTIRIADKAFVNKRYIRSVHIDEGVETIGVRAFRDCRNLVSVSIPVTVHTIEDSAFWGCIMLDEVTLPKSLKVLERGAFAGSHIRNIIIPEGITRLELDAFGNCGYLENIELPKSLKSIDRGVFFTNRSMKQITIPENVETLGELLFWNAEKLVDIYNHSLIPQQISNIHHNPAQITLHVPAESVEAYMQSPHWNEMQIVALPQ